MNEEDQKKALFKYKLIAPVLAESGLRQKDYLESFRSRVFDDSPLDKKSFVPKTIKKWIYKYRKYGLDGLKPSHRKDKGISRKITPELVRIIQDIASEFQFRTVKNLYDHLIHLGHITPDSFTYATLANMSRRLGLLMGTQAKARKAYEAEHVNDLWITDFMYGPYVLEGKKKIPSYLCAIIDDHSRLILASRFLPDMRTGSFEAALKTAITLFGVPYRLYADNGKVFSQSHLSLLSARLGFILVHSKPHDAPSRGKIERYFRTVRDCFIPQIYLQTQNQPFTMDDLNTAYAGWLHDKYNHKIHSTTRQTPYDRYMTGLTHIRPRKVTEQRLRDAFLHVIFRRVNNDATVRINNILFQVPARHIGKTIELRFAVDDPVRFTLYENEKAVMDIDRLDKHLNAKFPIKFNDPFDSDSDLFL